MWREASSAWYLIENLRSFSSPSAMVTTCKNLMSTVKQLVHNCCPLHLNIKPCQTPSLDRCGDRSTSYGLAADQSTAMWSVLCCSPGGHNHSNQLNNLHSHMSNYVPHSCGARIVKALQYNKIQPIQPTANPSMFDFSAPHRHADATTYPHMWLQSIEDMYIQPYIHKYCSITECDIDPSYCDQLCTALTH